MNDKWAGTEALGNISYVDAVLGVELEVDKVVVTGWSGSSSVSIGYLVPTTCTEAIGESEIFDTVLGVEL